MGCNNSSAIEFQGQVLPLPSDIINAYIDRVSLVMINKIKDKFESQLLQKQKIMTEIEFIQLFKHSFISDVRINLTKNRKAMLFKYFNNNKKNSLNVTKFIAKYCVLIKSDIKHFSQIIHKIYCQSIDMDKMLLEDFQDFKQDCLRYFKEGIQVLQQRFPLPWNQFFELIREIFNWQDLQASLHIVPIDQQPYKVFHQQLQKFNLQLLHKNTNYFIVSAEWIARWIFFYKYEDTGIKNNYYSTGSTSVLRKKSVIQKKRVSKEKINSSKIFINENHQNFQSFLPLTQITFTEIQGEYFGELKPLLVAQRDIAVINAKMWHILKSSLGSTIEFQREALDEFNVDLYPIFVYFYRIDNSGVIDSNSLSIVSFKRNTLMNQFKKTLTVIKQIGLKEQNSIFYYKNSDDIQFIQWDCQKNIQQIAKNKPRIIIVEVPSFLIKKFSVKYKREDLKIDNIVIGDQILAYFSYEDKFIQSWVLGVDSSKKQCKVHFNGYSYNYERWIKMSDIKLLQTELKSQQQSSVVIYKKQTLFWGIVNIGNTCFLNSVIQSLVSTSIFDQFFLKANLSQSKYPLSYDLSKIVKGLINRQKFNIFQFKRIVNKVMPIFAGYDQHDAHQFLNILLENLDLELKRKPNIIEEIFGGAMQSKFTCLNCKDIKFKNQKIYSISLPIPQYQFNYFVIMVFPIYTSNVRKIVLRLHKNAKIGQFLHQIQTRSNINRFDFNFIETSSSSFRNIRSQITYEVNQNKKVTDFGLNSTNQLWAYEKLRSTSYQYRLKKKLINEDFNQIKLNQFYDHYSNQEVSWGITKIIQISENQITIQFLKDNNIKPIKLTRTNQQPKIRQLFQSLGSKVTEKVFRKISLRRWSESSQKMVFCDLSLCIQIPKWASYEDTLAFIDQYLQKIKKENHSRVSINKSAGSFQNFEIMETLQESSLKITGLNSTITNCNNQPYIVHFLNFHKNCCIFCEKELQPFHKADEIRNCCQPEQKHTPLFWSGNGTSINFIVDWIDAYNYNEAYFHQIEIDKNSISAQQMKINEKISLRECLELWIKPETIEMHCQNCHYEQHLLQTSIKKAPIITIFHLKQFRYTEQGYFVKLNLNLQWSASIDLQNYYSSSVEGSKKSVYEMYSVITHKGSANAGHYTCLSKRKHPFERIKVWVNFDDDRTQVIKENSQVIQNAYLLFFKKVDMPSSAIVNFSI